MNGRTYDPWLGRMLQPDNYVQAAGYLQNYNRYSYALNNPLRYDDPTGEIWHIVIGAAVGGVINWATHGAEFSWEGLGYFGIGAAGALSAGIGAGVGGLVSGSGSFSFSVGSSIAAGSSTALGGAAVGAASGFTSGLIAGTGNALMNDYTLGESLNRGITAGAWGAAIGGITGGISGGIRASRQGLTGKDLLWKGGKGTSINRYSKKLLNIDTEFNLSNSKRSTINPLYKDSEFLFDGQDLYLVDNYSNGQQSLNSVYSAQSGGSNYAPIPAGSSYRVTNINTNYYSNPSYVRDGVGFFADIEPYRLANGRFGFEIHPDGALNGNWWVNNGTGGCIGIQENASRLIQLRDFISTYLTRNKSISLTVSY